jgi:hypothetical protein
MEYFGNKWGTRVESGQHPHTQPRRTRRPATASTGYDGAGAVAFELRDPLSVTTIGPGSNTDAPFSRDTST